MRITTLLFVALLALAGAGCGFVSGAAEANQRMQSEDPDERELGALQGKLLLTLGGGTAGVLLLFFGLRWYLTNFGTSSTDERRSELAFERAQIAQQGVLTLAVVVPRTGDPPALPASGAHVDALLEVIASLRRMRAQWTFVGARGTPPMQESDAAIEAVRLTSVFRERVSRPPDFRGTHAAWLALVTVRAPRDFSGVMPGDVVGFEASFAPLFELRSQDSVAFTAEWVAVDADGSIVERFPSLVRVT